MILSTLSNSTGGWDKLAATITLDNRYRISLSIEKENIVLDFVAEFEASGRAILRGDGHLPTRPPIPFGHRYWDIQYWDIQLLVSRPNDFLPRYPKQAKP